MIFIAILVVLLFPVILGGIIDATSIYNLNKNLKNSLDVATKSAVSRIDYSNVASSGISYINLSSAPMACQSIFANNMGFDVNTLKNTSNRYVTGTPQFQVLISNNYYGTPQVFPGPGSINSSITSSTNVSITVTKPTVFAIAKVQYSSVFFGKKYYIVRWAASELNSR